MALADIPGYGGYIQRRQMNERAPLAELEQVGAVTGLLGKLAEQDQARKAAALDAQYRVAAAALGPDATPEARLQVAAPFLGPKEQATLAQTAIDKRDQRAVMVQQAEDRRARDEQLIDLRYDTLVQTAANEEQKRQIEARRIAEKAAADKRHDETLRMLGTDRNEIARLRAETERLRAGQPRPGQGQMPAPALKMQQEELDIIGSAASMNADIAALTKQIDEGKLKLGLLRNLESEGRQFIGANDEASRRYGSLKATLEKLRNESLRLNKGVQTEGDAVRVWNEILARITDEQFVKQRLAEVAAINQRAIGLRKMNVDAIRRNYGLDPMDTKGYQSVPPSIGAGDQLTPAEQAELEALRAKHGRPAR
jgi:hypothetical protein